MSNYPFQSLLYLPNVLLCLFLLLFASPGYSSQYHDVLQDYFDYRGDSFYNDHLIAQDLLSGKNASQEQSVPSWPVLQTSINTPAKNAIPSQFYTPEPTLWESINKANLSLDASLIINKEIKLSPLLTLVLTRNPAIQAAKIRVTAEQQAVRQAATLDEILRQYSAFSEALMNGIGPMKGEPTQGKFPFPALASLKGRIALQDVNIAREKLEVTRRSVLTSTQIEFWRLFYNKEAQNLYTEMAQLLGHLETVARSRYETGAAGFQELIQVQITLATLQEMQKTLVESQASIEENIYQLSDLPKEAVIGSPILSKPIDSTTAPHDVTIDSLTEIALQHRQELRIEREALIKMELLIDLAESMILPPLTLNLADFSDKAILQVGENAPLETFASLTTAQNGAGTPKAPWFGTNDAFLEKTRHLLASKKAALRNLESKTRAQVRERWFELDKAQRSVALYQDKITGLSQAALEVVTQGYETGKTPFSQVNSSYQNWLNSRLTLAKSIRDVGIASAKLSESLGIKEL